MTFDQLASGKEDSQFVEIAGIVRSVRFDETSQYFSIGLSTGGGRLTVYAKQLPVASPDAMIASTIRHAAFVPRSSTGSASCSTSG